MRKSRPGSFQISFLSVRLPLASLVRRVSTNVSLSARILEVDFGLILRRVEEVVAGELYTGAASVHDVQPVEAEGVAAGDPVVLVQRQDLFAGEQVADVQGVALEAGDDQRQPGDLGGEVTDFDAAEV